MDEFKKTSKWGKNSSINTPNEPLAPLVAWGEERTETPELVGQALPAHSRVRLPHRRSPLLPDILNLPSFLLGSSANGHCLLMGIKLDGHSAGEGQVRQPVSVRVACKNRNWPIRCKFFCLYCSTSGLRSLRPSSKMSQHHT